MEVEDFDDDRFPPAQQPARSPLRNPTPQGRLPRRGDNAAFGLDSEVAAEANIGLTAQMRRRDVQGTQPQAADGFGLEAEANRPEPAGRPLGGLPPPLRGRGALQPLGSQPGTGTGASPLRPPIPAPRALTASRPQDSAAYGLAADTEEIADRLPGPGGLGAAPAALPARQPLPPPTFGLASEVDLRSALPPPRQQLPPPSPPREQGAYGLQEDVQEAAATGALQSQQRPQPEGYGLDDEIQQAQLLPPLPPPPPPPPVQFGLEQEIAAAGPLPGPVGPAPPPGAGAEGYGLESDIQEEQQLMQMWSRPLDGTYSLEQLVSLPDDQRWLHLDARQAERAMLDLAKQGQQPKVVDLKDVRQKVLDASHPPRLAYLTAVERAAPDRRLPANCRPSLLQAKLKGGQNRLRKLVEPVLDPGGQGFVDFSYSPDGALLPETSRVWQFGLALVQADGVGKTSLQRVRSPCQFIARLALFDRRANRFLGNVMGLRPEAVSNYDKRWEFDSKQRVVARCSCVQADPQAGTRLVTDDSLSVFIEFNTSYRLAVQDTANMPQSEEKCSRLLDEINTCWAMISFKQCIALTREVEISVPLYYGSIYDPKPMAALYAEKRSKAFWAALKPKESAVLQFWVGPLNIGKPPLVPYAYMPSTMLATSDLASALAAYRMSLALSLARQSGPFAAVSDPVVAGFPPLLSDHHLLAEFLTKWRDLTHKMTAVADADRGCMAPEVLPPLSAFVEAFRRCVIELAPLAYCPTIPPRHINNFVEYQGHRLRLVQHYCHVVDPRTNKILGARHPVEPLSHAGFEFLHAPFNVSEIRVCLADRLERPEPFYRH